MIAYQGVIAPEAIRAAGLIGDGRRDVGVLAVTSADRLNAAGQQHGAHARGGGVMPCLMSNACLQRCLPIVIWSP